MIDKPALSEALDKWYTLANDLSDTEAVNTANNYVGSEYEGNPNTWDVTRVTDMTSLFQDKQFEHHPLINNWNTKNVVTMDSMFKNSNFNNPINSLPISKFGESVTMSFVVIDGLRLTDNHPDGWYPVPGEDGIVPARIPKGITITNMTTGQTILDDVVLENYYHPDHQAKLNNDNYRTKGFLFTANSNDVLKIESGETLFGEMVFVLNVVAGNEATDFQGKAWSAQIGINAENLDELIYLTEKPDYAYTLTIRDTGKDGFQEGSDKTKTILDGVTVINEFTGRTLVTDFKLMSKYDTDGSGPFDTATTTFLAKQGEKLRLKTGDEFFDEMEIDILVLDKKESFKGKDAENLDKVLDMLPAITEQNDGVMKYSLKVLLEDTSEDGWQQDKAPGETIKYGFSVENLSTGKMLVDNEKIPSKLDNPNYAPVSLTISDIDVKDTLRFTTGNEHYDEMKITASVVDALGQEFQFFTGKGKIVETLNLTSRLSDFIPMKMTLENYESDKDLVVTYEGLDETVFLNGGKGPYEKQEFNFFVNKYTVYRVTGGALLGENPENAKMTLVSMDPECPYSLTLSGSELDNYSDTGYVCTYNSWNTGKVESFYSMFDSNTAFDQPIHRFNTTNVKNMFSMFKDSVFNQHINTKKVQYENEILSPEANYKLSLIDTYKDGWQQQNADRTIDIGVTLKTKDENGEFVIVRDNNGVPIDNVKLESPYVGGAQPYDLKEINFKSAAKVFYLTTGDENYEEMKITLESPDTGFSTTFSEDDLEEENLVDEPITVPDRIAEPEYWNTKNVRNMRYMFQNNLGFNKPVGKWNTKNVQNMESMFERAYQFNQNISTKLAYEGTQSEYIAWDTLNVTNMNHMMRMITFVEIDGKTDYYIPELGFWNNGEEIGQSNAPLNWNTTKVTQFQEGLFGCRYFNQHISTKEVTIGNKTYISFNTRNADLFRILSYTDSFNNGDVRGASTKPLYWSLRSTSSMRYLLGSATATVVPGMSYNQPMNTELVTIGTKNPITYTAWDTSNVTSMALQFRNQSLFNQPLDQWNTSNVTTMVGMFDDAPSFNQNINTKHKVLVSNNDLLPMKLSLIDTFKDGWQEQYEIVDGEVVYPDGTPFDNRTIYVGVTLKTKDENGEFVIVQDNNGVPIDNLKLNTSLNTFGNIDNSAVGPFDLKEIEFTGSPTAEYFITTGNEAYDEMKIIIESTDESRPFNYTIQGIPAEDKTDESIGAIYFIPSKEIVKNAISWDVSSVTTTYAIFANATSFDKPIDRWDTDSLLDTDYMFMGATSYDQPMNTKSRVRLLRNKRSTNSLENDIVFVNFTTEKEAIKFAYDAMKVYGRTSFEMGFNGSTFYIRILDKFETLEEDSTGTVSVGCLSEYEETLFGDLAKDSIDGFSTWNTANITSLLAMFSRARSFDQDISNWNIRSVTQLRRMFQQANSYNQPMSTKKVNKGKEGEYVAWNTANITSFSAMFDNAHSFDQDIENWDVRNGIYFTGMFQGATKFNHHLQDWNLLNAERLNKMFQCAESFNKPLPTAKLNDPYLDTLLERGEPLPMRLTLIDGNTDIPGWLGPLDDPYAPAEGVTLKDQNGTILTDKQGRLIENRRLKNILSQGLEPGESFFEKEIDFEVMPDQEVYITTGITYWNDDMTIVVSSLAPEIPFVKTFEGTAAQKIENELVYSIKKLEAENDLWSLHNVKNVSYMFAGSTNIDFIDEVVVDGQSMPIVDYTTLPLYSTLDYTVEEPPTMDTIYSTSKSSSASYKRFGGFAFSKDGKITFTASLPEGEQSLAVYFGFSNIKGSDYVSKESIENYTSKVVIDGTEKNTYTINVPANGKSYTRLHLLLEKPRSGTGQVYIDDIICLNDNATEETYKKQMSFDQDISSWDVSNVENFQGMFKDNTAFDGNGSNLMDNWLIKKD